MICYSSHNKVAVAVHEIQNSWRDSKVAATSFGFRSELGAAGAPETAERAHRREAGRTMGTAGREHAGVGGESAQ